MSKSNGHKKTPALAGAEVWGNEINYQEEIVMSNNSTAVSKSNVIPFHAAKLLLVEHEGQPFVPMKPIVEGMGLAWQAQHAKLTSGRFSSVITMIVTTGFDGKQYEMACLPLKKLPGWLMSIHASKVRADLRKNVLAYQDECDDALWAYWNEGHAVNHRSPDQAMTVLGQTIGTDGFHMLGAVVKGKVSSLPVPAQRRATAKIWSQTHAAFGVRSAADIPAEQLDAARNFIAAYVVLEGDYIQREAAKPDRLNIHFPIQALAGRRAGMLTDRGDGHAWLDVGLQDVGYHHDSLCELIIFELQKAGYVVDAAQWELATYRNKLRGIDSFVRGLNRVVEDPQRYAVMVGDAA